MARFDCIGHIIRGYISSSSTEEVKGLLNLRGAEFMLRPSDIHDLRERTRIGLHWQISDERAALCREDIPPLALSWILK